MNKIRTVVSYAKKVSVREKGTENKVIYVLSIYIYFLDIVFSAIIYNIRPDEYVILEVNKLSLKERSMIVTRKERDMIVKKYNNSTKINSLENKTLFLTKYKDYLGRDFLIVEKSNINEFYRFVKKHNKFIVKFADGSQGENIKIYNVKEEKEILNIYNEIIELNYDIVEELLTPHHDFKKINKKGLPIIRIISFLNIDNSVKILSASLDSSVNDAIVNMHRDALKSILDINTGKVITDAVNSSGTLHEVHPITKNKFRGFTVPYWNELIKLASEIAQVSPDVRYIGWDIAVTENGPVVIEGNVIKPGITSIQSPYYQNINNLYKRYKNLKLAIRK